MIPASMDMEQMVASYGYYAIFAGTFLEGETILVIGGFLAHRGYLELPWVIAAAFGGTLFGDQLYYHIGRINGLRLLERWPRGKKASARVLAMLRQHPVPLVLGFRFLYGLRIVTPILIGASGLPPLRYAALNAAGAAIWAIAIGTAGYLIGQALELLLEEVKRYELWVLGAIAGVGVVAWVVHWLRNN